MFIKFTRLNRANKPLETLVDSATIESIVEQENTPVRLYDDCGEMVEERPSPREFVILTTNGHSFRVDQENYELVVKTLTK